MTTYAEIFRWDRFTYVVRTRVRGIDTYTARCLRTGATADAASARGAVSRLKRGWA